MKWLQLCCRFVATVESHAHPTYKRKLIQLDKTGYTDIFGRARWPGAPQRVLQTPFFSDQKSLPINENELDKPVIGRTTIHDMVRTKSCHHDNYKLKSCSPPLEKSI